MPDDYIQLNFRTSQGLKKIYIKKQVSGQETESVRQESRPIITGNISVEKFQLVDARDEIESKKMQSSVGLGVLQINVDGMDVPDIGYEVERQDTIDEEAVKKINIKYPLIPRNPKQGEKVFAWANAFYNTKINEPVYYVIEPPIDENDRRLLNEIKEYIQEKIDINFSQMTRAETIKYIIALIEKAFYYLKVSQDGPKGDIYKYYILRDFIGMGKIEPFMQDKQIEDISCDGVNIPIYIYHRDPKFGSIRTNIMFTSQEELDYFVNKLSERCGKTISVAKPLLDGSLPDGSRMQATLGSDIARRGSNFTIRMFTEKPLTPIDMIIYGTCDLKMMAYYWFLVENGFSILVSGGTASGKTTLLNVLSLFIKPQLKIVSIEDTAELKIPHAHWIPEVARTPIAEEGKVDMFELLRESLRQRPDYIIVGEVRGQEAYVLFQQMATGHPGLSTIHAENFPKLMDRLTSPPISLPPSLIQNLDAIIFVKRVKRGRRYVRKIFQSIEVIGYNSREQKPLVNEMFRWISPSDSFKIMNQSGLLKKIADSTGMTSEEIGEELKKRVSVLRWLLDQKITDYKKVASVINLFYMSPDFLLERIGRV
jgi:flagellar protein FlaI